jgi:AcrR family transcriptional regulator
MSPKTPLQFEETRQKSKDNIVATALTLFSKHGFEGTSIRMIATESKVSLGLMYNYFGSKEDLILAILKDAFANVDDAIINKESSDPKEQFQNTIHGFVKMIVQHKAKFRLLAQMGLHQDKFELANQLTKNKYNESVARIARNLVAIGHSNQSDLEARLIVAALDGIAFETLLMDDTIPLTELSNHLINKYCNK